MLLPGRRGSTKCVRVRTRSYKGIYTSRVQEDTRGVRLNPVGATNEKIRSRQRAVFLLCCFPEELEAKRGMKSRRFVSPDDQVFTLMASPRSEATQGIRLGLPVFSALAEKAERIEQ